MQCAIVLFAALFLPADSPAVSRLKAAIESSSSKIEALETATAEAAHDAKAFLAAIGVDWRRELKSFEARLAVQTRPSKANVAKAAAATEADRLVDYLRTTDAKGDIEDAIRRQVARAPKSLPRLQELSTRVSSVAESMWIDLRYTTALQAKLARLERRLARIENQSTSPEVTIDDIQGGDLDLAKEFGVVGRPLLFDKGFNSAMLRPRRYRGYFELKDGALVPGGHPDAKLHLTHCAAFELSTTFEYSGYGGLAVKLDHSPGTPSILAVEHTKDGTRSWMVNRGKVLFETNIEDFASGATLLLKVSDGQVTFAVNDEVIHSGPIKVREGNVILARPRSPHGDLDLRIERIYLRRLDEAVEQAAEDSEKPADQ